MGRTVEIVSAGESFQVDAHDRTYQGAIVPAVFKVSGDVVPGAAGQVQMAAAPSIAGVTMLVVTGFNQGVIAGANASVTPVSTVLAGTKVGDKVVGVIGLAGTAADTNLSADFETVISTAGHILQSSVDLSATTAILVTIAHTS